MFRLESRLCLIFVCLFLLFVCLPFRCVELDHSQTASEYIMQLVFSLINNICQKLSPNSIASIAGNRSHH